VPDICDFCTLVCIYYVVPFYTHTYSNQLKIPISQTFFYRTFVHEVSQKQQDIFSTGYLRFIGTSKYNTALICLTDETKLNLLHCERSIYTSDWTISAVNKNNDFDWLIKKKRFLILILTKSYKRLLLKVISLMNYCEQQINNFKYKHFGGYHKVILILKVKMIKIPTLYTMIYLQIHD
jgi:hypothetical protein